jgi:toxin FitB
VKGYLIDTNVVSELRRPKRSLSVVAWFSSVSPDGLYLSVLTLGELRQGIESMRRKDPAAAHALERWFNGICADFSEKILPVDAVVAERWGRLSQEQPIPSIDGLLAATAAVHDLTIVTRNVADFERSGVALINPFAFSA